MFFQSREEIKKNALNSKRIDRKKLFSIMQREKRDIDILREITEDIGGVDNKL